MKNLIILSSMFWLLSCANLENVYDDTYDAALKPIEVKNNDEAGYSDYIKNNQDGYAVVEESQENKLFKFGNTNQNYGDNRYNDRDCDCMNDVRFGVGNRPYWNAGPYSGFPNYNYYLTSNNFSHMSCYGGSSNYLGWSTFGYGWYSPYAGPNSYWYNNPWDFYGGYNPYNPYYAYGGYNPYGYYGNGYYNYGYYNNANNYNNNSSNNGVVASGNSGNHIYGHRGSTSAISSNTTSYDHTVKGVGTNNDGASHTAVAVQGQFIYAENLTPTYATEGNSALVQSNTVVTKPANNQFAVNSTVQNVDRLNGTVTTNLGQNTISTNQPYQNSYARYTAPVNSGGTNNIVNSTSSTSRNGSNNNSTTHTANRINNNVTTTTYNGNRTTTSGGSNSSSGNTSGTTRSTSSSRR